VASSPEGDLLTEAHRLAQIETAREVQRSLLTLWPLLSLEDIDGTMAVWLQAALLSVMDGAKKSVDVAAAYYTAFRHAEVAGTMPADVAALRFVSDPQKVATVLRLAGPEAVKQALARGSQTAGADGLASVLSTGQRLTLLPGRATIEAKVAADPKARGRARVTSGNACAFCRMLSSRGAVYGKRGDFKAHNDCGCSLEPVMGSNYRPSPSVAANAEVWKAYRADRKANPDRYEGIGGPKQAGPNKGEQRDASEAMQLGFRRYLDSLA